MMSGEKKRAVYIKPPAQAFVMPHTPVKRHRAPQHFCAAADSQRLTALKVRLQREALI
jgi:hypothetical protein